MSIELITLMCWLLWIVLYPTFKKGLEVLTLDIVYVLMLPVRLIIMILKLFKKK